MTKKVHKTKKCLLCLNKNLNQEILTKNLVTFKRWDEIKIKNF